MAKNTVEIELLLKNKSVIAGINKTEQDINSLGKSTTKTASGMSSAFKAVGSTLIAIGFVKIFKESLFAASDLEEEINKFNVVFKDVKDEAEGFAQVLQDEFGQSEISAKKLLSSTGDLLTGLGFTQEAALDLSKQVATLGIDLASFSNYAGGAEGATEALTKALLGETESAKSLGIVIRQDTKEFKAQIEQLQKSEGLTREQAKAQVILSQAYSQSKNAIGDYNRSSGSFANTLRRLQAAGENLKGLLGKELLGGFTALAEAFIAAADTGSPLIKMFQLVFKGVNRVVIGIAQLVNLLNVVSSTAAAATDTKNLEQNNKKAKRVIDNLKKETKVLKQLQDEQKNGIDNTEQIAAAEANIKRYNQVLDSYRDNQNLESSQFNDSIIAADKAANAIRIAEQKLAGEESLSVEKEKAKKALETLDNIESEKTEKAKAKTKTREDALKKIIEDNEKKQYYGQLLALDNFIDEATLKWGEYYENITGLALQYTSAISEISQMSTDNEVERLNQSLERWNEYFDQQEQKAYENAGVAEQTALEKARSELEILNAELAAETDSKRAAAKQTEIDEKAKEVRRLEIKDEFDKLREEKDAEIERKKTEALIKNAKLQKKINIIETIIATATGAMNAYKALAGIPYVGPALGAAAAAAVAGLGAEKVRLIKNQPLPMATGGIVPGNGDGDTVPTVLTPGELVVPKEFTDEVLDRQANNNGPMNIFVQIGASRFFAEVQSGVRNGDIIIRDRDLSTI